MSGPISFGYQVAGFGAGTPISAGIEEGLQILLLSGVGLIRFNAESDGVAPLLMGAFGEKTIS